MDIGDMCGGGMLGHHNCMLNLRSHMSKECIECTVFPHKMKSLETTAAQTSLRKKIAMHAKSSAQVTATKILNEKKQRTIQSSTGLSVAQYK